jgi:hypothetical protein
MIVEVQVNIAGPKEAIWGVVTDIANASENISGIEKVEVLEQPEDGLVGLKWRETRTMFGKTATEVMWITDSAENEFYKTRAESHGSIYISTIAIAEQNGSCSLTMTFESKAQSFLAKLLCIPMGLVFKGTMKKAILKDLNDIKAVVEQQRGE